MKKFTFTLQKVLDYKSQILDVEKAELASEQKKLDAINVKIMELEGTMQATQDTLQGVLEKGVVASQIMIYKVYISDMVQHIKELERLREQQFKVVEKKRAEVVDISVEIASYDKLKEKQLEEYRQAEQRAAENEIEEFIKNLANY